MNGLKIWYEISEAGKTLTLVESYTPYLRYRRLTLVESYTPYLRYRRLTLGESYSYPELSTITLVESYSYPSLPRSRRKWYDVDSGCRLPHFCPTHPLLTILPSLSRTPPPPVSIAGGGALESEGRMMSKGCMGQKCGSLNPLLTSYPLDPIGVEDY